jgi:hypothetical protein
MRGVRRRTVVTAVGVFLLVGALSACAPTAEPKPSASTSAFESPSASASPTPTAEPAPTLSPDGSAADNQDYFDLVLNAALAANTAGIGRTMVDGLVAAGFDRTLMQVTPDETIGGRAADSVQVSVRFGEDCLIGQYGASIGYVSTIGPALASGSCLIGTTRPIDW